MRCYVVTEGQSDVQLLKRVLTATGVVNAEFVAGGGKSSVASMAQSLLVRRRLPVAVVMDADSSDARRVQDQKRIYFDLLRSYASGTAFRVMLMVPEIETVFFEDSEVLSHELHLSPNASSDRDSEAYPKRTLMELLRSRGISKAEEFVQRLDTSSLERLSRTSLFRELSSFLSDPRDSGTWSSEPRHLQRR